MEINSLEILGYVASVLIVISMFMASLLKLRILNLIGAFIFSIYGFLIGSYPVGIVNAFIVFANIYHLMKFYKIKDNFALVELTKNNLYLKEFIEKNGKEMEKHFSEYFKFDQSNYLYSFLILRNTAVIGILLCKRYNENSLLIDVDYTIKGHRDLKAGTFVYKDNKQFFKERGFDNLVIEPKTYIYSKYVEDMGFEKQEKSNIYSLKI